MRFRADIPSQFPKHKELNSCLTQFQGLMTIQHAATAYNFLWRKTGKGIIQIRSVAFEVISVCATATRNLSNYTQSADARKKSIQQRPRSGHKVTHQVQSGDTLWDISRKYKVKVRELAKWNAMAPRDPLMPGQQLVIWSKQPQTLTRGNNALDLPLQKINYRVRQGDSLARIAQKFQVTVRDLQRWNNLNTQKYIQPGQRITLYVDVTQQSGG
mgnify:CR=1 FL=1